MVMVDSIYKYMDKYIKKYPIWKVHNKKFTLVPTGINDSFGYFLTTSMSFRVVQHQCKGKPTLNQIKIVSKKAKDFLFEHFKDLLQYIETINYEDNCIDIDITIIYKE